VSDIRYFNFKATRIRPYLNVQSFVLAI